MLFPEQHRYAKRKPRTRSLRKKPVCAAPMSRPEKASEKVCFCASLFRGSLTVEAAAALPLFFLALLMLIGMLNIYAVQARVSLSLDSSARKLGMYAYTAGEEKGTLTDAACQAYAAGRLKMPRGCGNLRFEGDTWDGSRIKLKIRYEYRLPVGFFKMPPIPLYNQAEVHAWVGYQGDLPEGPGEEEAEEMVFITENQSVYHTDRNCTYLQLTVYQANRSQVEELRNEQGGRYHACEKCGGGGACVYLSPQGEAYHSSRDCSGLTRHVEMVKKSEVAHKGEFSRCAGR